MEYKNGLLILTDGEREILALATMNKVEAQYPASYFMGSMAEIKAGAEERITLTHCPQQQCRTRIGVHQTVGSPIYGLSTDSKEGLGNLNSCSMRQATTAALP